MEIFSEKYEQVFEALFKAKKEMKVVLKDSRNPHLKNKYASLGAHIDATEEALLKNDLILMCTMQPAEKNPLLVMTLMHKSGQWIRSYLELLNSKGDSQGQGSAISYQRRYGMSALFNLIAEDDDGERAKASDNHQNSVKVQSDNVNHVEKIKPELAKALELELSQTSETYRNSVYARLKELEYMTIYDIKADMFDGMMSHAIKNKVKNEANS